MTVKERIIKYLDYKKISKSEFGRIIGVSNSYITSMRKSIQPDKVESIALNFPDLNMEWLMTEKGEMIKKSDKNIVMDPPSVYETRKKNENLTINDLVNALNNMSEASLKNAIANERNSRNMEKMLDLLSQKEKNDVVRNAGCADAG